MFERLINILVSFLGDPKNGISSDDQTQYQFNCPQCSEDSGMPDGDGKYNLEVSIDKGVYRCWKCENENHMSGKISDLIKKYGGEDSLYQYREEIKNIKKSKEYELHFPDQGIALIDDEAILELPKKTFDFSFDGNKREELALKYLIRRGLSERIINKYRLKYTDEFCPDRNFKNRIIIPSYNKYGELNYYTGRDYSNKSFRKYYNADVKKTEIIFNEQFINWDGDVVLVEGPADHIVVPNSIPLLGKIIKQGEYPFDCIIKESTQKVIIFLDNDAMTDAIELCKRLACYELCGRLKIISTQKLLEIINKTKKLNLNKLDPSKLFELYGYRGISWAIKMAENYNC
jgi:hypothetical protein